MNRSLVVFLLAGVSAGAQTPEQTEYFEKKVRPLLAARCQGCHNARVKTSGLDMSGAEGFRRGGGSGPLVGPDPGASLLLQVTSYEGRLKMPPGGKLGNEDLTTLRNWVDMGAPWPGAAPVAKASPGGRQITDSDREFWAFRPVRSAQPPTVRNKEWVANAIDRFILAKLEDKGLSPAPQASKTALLRRVTFDLTGLPPTEAEIRDFLSDETPEAWAKVVDRLLASPRYGEKWGRHWLDIARYADSTGNDEDHRYPHAWRYRDYVIDAFNSDLPYDQFVREQIAGDLMPAPKPGEVNRRGIIATGFLALGAKAIAQQDKKKMLYDVYDEQLDVTTKSLMGITLACARCHDHKFDPLLTKDYYSMVGMFASTRSFKDPESHVSELLFTPLAPADDVERYERHQKRVAAKGMEIEDLIDRFQEQRMAPHLPRLGEYMMAARRVYADGADASALAKETGLSEELIQKWVQYLKPRPESRVHLDKWQNAPAEQMQQVAREYQATFDKQLSSWRDKVTAWRKQFQAATPEHAPAKPKFEPSDDRFFFETYFQGPFGMPRREREKSLPPDVQIRVASLRKEQEALKASSPPEPDMACAVQEGEPVQQKVFVRGDYSSPGVDAPRAFPLVLTRDAQPGTIKGSGRLELANWITRPDHPLTARVMANRIWFWHFGEGIVRTPDNFGQMGERPTHPELLDHLASEFVRSGWSVKALHRLILLSNTYRMASSISDDAYRGDPENRLFSRFPRRRLTVEEVRDGLLAIDGSLDYTAGGTLQEGTGTDGENSSGRLSLRPETNRRRMVYLPLRRANLPTLLNLFDFGDATTASGKRALTTVAPQALFMMNSEFVAERARRLAEQTRESGPPAERLRTLYVRVLNREPAPAETDAALSYVSSFEKKFPGGSADPWLSLARTLIASNEFIYLD